MALTIKFESQGVKRGKESLSKLLDLVDKNDQQKLLGNHFGAIASLRNHFMHPRWHSYAGPMSHSFVVRCVNVLNTLFYT